MTVTSLTGHRPYRDRNTDDLHRDRAYWWARLHSGTLMPMEEHFTEMRLFDCEHELRFRGDLKEFRVPPARTAGPVD